MRLRPPHLHCFILLMILGSCGSPNKELTGHYHYDDYGFFEKGWDFVFTKNYQTVGSDLWLEKDSTFKFQTCGRISTGFWSAQNDTLFLYEETARWRMDSLNEVGLNGVFQKPFNEPQWFLISRNSLKRNYGVWENGKKYHTHLVKSD